NLLHGADSFLPVRLASQSVMVRPRRRLDVSPACRPGTTACRRERPPRVQSSPPCFRERKEHSKPSAWVVFSGNVPASRGPCSSQGRVRQLPPQLLSMT